MQKGFTIIELIIVIGIIAVLAAIVIAGVAQYIVKGKDNTARTDLNTALVNASVYFSMNGNFDGFVTGEGTGDDSYTKVYNAILNTGYSIGDIASSSTSSKWCMSVKLKQFNPVKYYCVDSSNAKKESTRAICANGSCPD